MRTIFFLAFLIVRPGSAFAQEVRLGAGFDAGYLIAGDGAVKGRKVVKNGNVREYRLDSDTPTANPTGGLTLMPRVHVSASSWWRWLDLVYVQAPMLISPFEPERTGFVDANDAGVVLHPACRAWSVLVAGTFAPANALFCNVKWCLREWLPIGGGVLNVFGAVLETKDGGGLHVDFIARVLYAQPTAWTWAGLTPEERKILPLSWMFNGGAHWTW